MERITIYTYDATHNVKTITNPGIKDDKGNPIILAEYEYDSGGNVTAVTYSDGKESWTTSYSYDNAGRLDGTSVTKEGLEAVYSMVYGYSSSVTGPETRRSQHRQGPVLHTSMTNGDGL